MICLSLGYPAHEEEVLLLKERQGINPLDHVTQVMTREELLDVQDRVKHLHLDEDIYDYIVSLSEATRTNEQISLGMSPRGTIALMELSKAVAFIHERNCVFPEDVREAFPFVASHRIMLTARAKVEKVTKEDIMSAILKKVKIR